MAARRRPPTRKTSAEAPVTRVVAVFRHRARAEEVAESLHGRGRISIEDRRATDDPPTQPAAPGVEPVERRRDREVAGHVFRNTVTVSALYAVAGAVLFGLIAGAIAGWGTTWFWVAAVVGAVTGSVLGGIQGGIGAAMLESEKEEGTVLIFETRDDAVAREAERTLRAAEASRVDVETPQQRLAG